MGERLQEGESVEKELHKIMKRVDKIVQTLYNGDSERTNVVLPKELHRAIKQYRYNLSQLARVFAYLLLHHPDIVEKLLREAYDRVYASIRGSSNLRR